MGATRVHANGSRAQSRAASRALACIPAIAFALAACAVNAIWPVPLWLVALYAFASVLCFAVYAVDKSAASSGRRRVPERTLLALGLLGGWPGAVVAQQTLRHKTIKPSFRRAFWATVLVNVVIFAVVTTPLLSTIGALA